MKSFSSFFHIMFCLVYLIIIFFLSVGGYPKKMGVITQFSGKVLWKVDFLVFRPHPFLCLEVCM